MSVWSRIRARTITVTVGTALVVGACGGADDSLALRIDGVDIAYDSDTYEADAGPARIEFRNQGSLAHNIVFRDTPGAPVAAGVGEFLPAGQTENYDVVLVAGEYDFYCSVPGHEVAGMVGQLVVS